MIHFITSVIILQTVPSDSCKTKRTKMSDNESRLLLDEGIKKKLKLYNEKKPNMETTPNKSNVNYHRLIGTPSPSPSHCTHCGHEEKITTSRNVKKSLFHSKNKK